jgi:uncharacterized protein (TIGR03437 family)
VVRSIVNGASFTPGFSSNCWLTIQGTNLAPVTRIWQPDDFAGDLLPSQLDGVRVHVNGRPAFVYFISPTQLNVLAPDDTATGQVRVEVFTREGRSGEISALKNAVAPAMFAFSPRSGRFAAAVHTDGALVAPVDLFPGANARSARPGDIILLFGTGFGSTNPLWNASTIVASALPLGRPVTVRLGGMPAEVLFAGLTGSGLYQFNVRVPDLPNGDALVSLTVDSSSTQTNLFLPVLR